MPIKYDPENPGEMPPVKQPEIKEPVDPEHPVIPMEDPTFIPEEDPDETPPTEVPPPGEGPE